MNPTAVAAALSITILQLWQLMRNPGFPVPTSNAGDGVNIVWNTAAIIAFVSLWNAAKANGWIISTADLPVANLATMAVTPIGSRYMPAGADPLWDDAP